MEDEEVENEPGPPPRTPHAQLLSNRERKVLLVVQSSTPCPEFYAILIEKANQRYSLWHAGLRSLGGIIYRSLPRVLSHHHREHQFQANRFSPQLAESQHATVLANPLNFPTSVASRASKSDDRISQNATVLTLPLSPALPPLRQQEKSHKYEKSIPATCTEKVDQYHATKKSIKVSPEQLNHKS